MTPPDRVPPTPERSVMRRIIPLLLAAFLGVLGLTTACQATGTGYLHVAGGQLLDASGQPVQLRGVAIGTTLLKEPWLMGQTGTTASVGETNMRAKLATLVGQADSDTFWASYEQQFITQADFTAIASYGFNVVRVPFNARYLSSQFPILDNYVTWAQQAGLYLVLDMHAAPCSQNPYFTSDSTDGTAGLWYGTGAAACRNQTVAAWQQIAARYADDPTIAAYDLLNEPDGGSMTNPALIGLYSQIITAIRSVDPHHVVMVEGRNFTKDVSPFTAPLDPNLILSMHQYASSTLMPVQNINTEVAAADRLGGVPVWVGEFGLDLPQNITPQLARFDAQPRIVGWSYWTWKMAARSDHQHGLNEYPAPAGWVPVINWLTGKTTVQPTPAAARTAMSSFLAATHTASPNTEMLDALQADLG